MTIRQWQKRLLAVMIFPAIGALFIWTHAGRGLAQEEGEKEQRVEAPSRVSAEHVLTVLTLSPQAQEKSGIVTSPLKSVSYQKELKAYGTVLPFDTVVALRNQYAAAKAQLKSAAASYAASSRIYERRDELFRERTIDWQTLQGIEATQLRDQAALSSAKVAFHVVKSQILQLWGPVLAKWVYEASPEFNRLASQNDVLIQVTLPSGVAIESLPEAALVDSSYGEKVSARFVSAAPRTDQRIQGQSFYYTVSVTKAGMLPGMSVTAYLATGPRVQGVVVPSSAVVWLKGAAWVYVQEHTVEFIRRRVSVDNPVAEGFFVTKGFAPEERIVVKGAQLLLSEEFRSQIREEG